MDLISADNLIPREEKVQSIESLKEKEKNSAAELGIEYRKTSAAGENPFSNIITGGMKDGNNHECSGTSCGACPKN